MSFALLFTPSAESDRDSITDPKRAKTVRNTLAKLANDPGYQGLATHHYVAFDTVSEQRVWESYVENQTSSAWRIWWAYGPEREQITVLMIGPHP
jgi:hypothetical protein